MQEKYVLGFSYLQALQKGYWWTRQWIIIFVLLLNGQIIKIIYLKHINSKCLCCYWMPPKYSRVDNLEDGIHLKFRAESTGCILYALRQSTKTSPMRRQKESLKQQHRRTDSGLKLCCWCLSLTGGHAIETNGLNSIFIQKCMIPAQLVRRTLLPQPFPPPSSPQLLLSCTPC